MLAYSKLDHHISKFVTQNFSVVAPFILLLALELE
jgi:hypothetical protein